MTLPNVLAPSVRREFRWALPSSPLADRWRILPLRRLQTNESSTGMRTSKSSTSWTRSWPFIFAGLDTFYRDETALFEHQAHRSGLEFVGEATPLPLLLRRLF